MLGGGASSDIRFYKERAGILEGSQGWSDEGGGIGPLGPHPSDVEGGININYVSKGSLRLRVPVILPCTVSRVLRLREFASTSLRDLLSY